MSPRERKELLRRLDDVRDYPAKTCPASRHVHMIVEALLDTREGYGADLRRLGYEPEHLAGSIASVLENLWQARRWMKWEKLPPTRRFKHNGHWVPDLEAITAQAGVTRMGGDGEAGSGAEGTSTRSSHEDAPNTPSTELTP